MLPYYADTKLTINLEAIGANYLILKEKSYPASCAAVVKANAYGLGVEHVAPYLARLGCQHFFVATLDEALTLKPLLHDKESIYVLNGIRSGQAGIFRENGLIPVLNTTEEIANWLQYGHSVNQPLPCVIHADTGMNRLGVGYQQLLDNPTMLEGLNIRYMVSHLACADQPEATMNMLQLERFSQLQQRFAPYPTSLANSSGIFIGKAYHQDLTRPGSALYGVNPTPKQPNPMQPVVTLTSSIIQIRSCSKGEYVGYDEFHRLSENATIAVVPIGYADGYLRSGGSKAQVAIGGHLVPVVGRVSMDLLTLDVSNLPEYLVQIGQTVEILGNHITIDDLAKQMGTIGYEILTSLGQRYCRYYHNPLNFEDNQLTTSSYANH